MRQDRREERQKDVVHPMSKRTVLHSAPTRPFPRQNPRYISLASTDHPQHPCLREEQPLSHTRLSLPQHQQHSPLEAILMVEMAPLQIMTNPSSTPGKKC